MTIEMSDEDIAKVVDYTRQRARVAQWPSDTVFTHIARDVDGWWALFTNEPSFSKTHGSYFCDSSKLKGKHLVCYTNTHDKPCCIPLQGETDT